MTLGLYDRERRRRREAVVGIAKILLLLGFLGAGCAFAYQIGVEQTKGRNEQLTADVERLAIENQRLLSAAQQLQAVARTSETRALDAERRYAQDVPTGDLARIVQIARERKQVGVPSDRLAFVLANTEVVRTCDAPDTRRFAVQTPIGPQNPNSSVRFGNGLLTVTATGASARNRDGNPEAWFDPTQPVAVKFTPLGGRNEATANGTLPINHVMVHNNVEWRFAVIASARSFAEVTAERCPLP
ncbi:MAG: hypothetical protein ACK5YI_18990 [Rhodospirillales bacterium]|jgi:hypothetical protein